jgi:zinc transport system ATP-binding protein
MVREPPLSLNLALLMTQTKNILKLSEASTGYDTLPSILEHISLEIFSGDWLACLGPNGGGKTTLLKTLMGVLPLRSGERESANKAFGYVPQRISLTLNSPILVNEFLDLNPNHFGKGSQHLERLITDLQLRSLLNKHLERLSGGQLQRVMLAYALCGKPSLVFLDEFLDGVDCDSRDRMLRALTAYREEWLTIVEVSHDFPTVVAHANRAVLVKNTIVYDGSPTDPTFREQFLIVHQYQGLVEHVEPI